MQARGRIDGASVHTMYVQAPIDASAVAAARLSIPTTLTLEQVGAVLCQEQRLGSQRLLRLLDLLEAG